LLFSFSVTGNLYANSGKKIADFAFIKGILHLHLTRHNNFVPFGQLESGIAGSLETMQENLYHYIM
jgi:hypothetical protein